MLSANDRRSEDFTARSHAPVSGR